MAPFEILYPWAILVLYPSVTLGRLLLLICSQHLVRVVIWCDGCALYESRLYLSLMISLRLLGSTFACVRMLTLVDKIILSSLARLMCNLQSALVIVQVDVCKSVETAENGMWGILRVRSDCPQTQFCGAFLPLILRVYNAET
jgi:hypothetical protein